MILALFNRTTRWAGLLLAMAALLVGGLARSSGAQQLSYSSGLHVAPAFEGWTKNDDGSFNLMFGYMNSNWEEEVDVPVGPANFLSPGPADQGQPAHLYPRRNRFVFSVRVPADFGDKTLVWTLTSHGKTVSAYATLRPDYFLDAITIISERGGILGGSNPPALGLATNRPPTVRVEGDQARTVKVGTPLALVSAVHDDGVPGVRKQQPRPASAPEAAPEPAKLVPPQSPSVSSMTGLRVSWYVYRGAGRVTFDPPQIKEWEDTREGANSPWAPRWVPPPLPPDGRTLVRAVFETPGTYVLRCHADDGGYWADQEVTVTVTP